MSAPMRFRPNGLIVLSALVAAACSETQTENKPQPGLRFVSGATGSDTIEAILLQPLVLEYRDEASQPLAYRDVFFSTSLTLTFDPANVSTRPSFATTDANGRITARVRFGKDTGSAGIAVAIPGAGLGITASYIVRPGAPARIALAPRDTVLYPAARLPLRQEMQDRYKHPTTGTIVSNFLTNNDLTVSSTGIATPRNTGRDTIIVQTGVYADTVFLTVLPTTGTIAASLFGTAAGIATMNLDGSGYKEYAKSVSASPFSVTYPRWSVDKKSVFARIQIGPEARIWTIPLDGTASRRFLVTPSSTFDDFPSPSPDGQWLYYHTGTPAFPNDPLLHRAKVDGTGIETLATETPPYLVDKRNLNPQVSSSGEWVAYTGTDGSRTAVRSVATGVRTAFNRAARWPTWAPTGTRFAYVNETPRGLYTAEPDGSDERLIVAGVLDGPLSWTPDGKYILGYQPSTNLLPGYYTLIEVATGTRYRLSLNIGQHAVLKPYN